MITACPACNRQFRIYAQQLSAARGMVQCGFCGEQFNALERLYDHPSQIKTTTPLPTAEDADTDEPRFEIPETPTAIISAAAQQPDPSASDDDIAIDLLVTETRPRSWFTTVMWTTGVLILFAVILLQLAWFNRDFLLERYPEYLPLAKQLCEHYDCDLIRDHDLQAIVLVNRDVRDHPRFNNALLVNITLENQSQKTQPYPGIQFILFDNTGKVTAYRRLQATDYLEPDINLDAGMRPGLPLHLVLEVAEPAETTVGFEFGFF